jgi:membrane protein YqaA with SNARE-associated domain
MESKPTEKAITESLRLMVYHRYFRSSGFYRFLLKAFLKLFVAVFFVVLALVLIQKFIVTDLKDLFFVLTDRVPDYIIWTVFSLSESFLGLIPPDLFIVWGKQTSYPMLTVTILALVSYAGGFVSYGIGVLLMKHKGVSTYVHKKHEKVAMFLRRWGGFFILIAAMLPVPYSMATMMSGMVGYRLDRLAIFGLARIVRFYLYAVVILGIM